MFKRSGQKGRPASGAPGAQAPVPLAGVEPLLAQLMANGLAPEHVAALNKHLLTAGQDPAAQRDAIAAWARAAGQERLLADTCTQLLQALGTLPEPEGTEHRYRIMPEDQLRPLEAFGEYWSDVRREVQAFRAAFPAGQTPVFLDVGGNKGECRGIAEGFSYWLVDLQPRTAEADCIITGDVCRPLELGDASVDVIFSHQVWEHLAEPWLACRELGRLLRPGGLFITITLFAYRYHPLPEDYFRFTHVGLATLHERYAHTETVLAKYDLSQRRADRRGGGHLLASDIPPIDWLGGFRENWFVYYIGRKPVR